MADYFNRSDRERRDLFSAPDDSDLSSNNLDLQSKLTLLFKRGVGQRYVSKPKKLDAKTTDKHKEYIKSQFTKATYDHYVRSTTLEVDRRKSFEDYTVMDYTPEISSALDIYADECLTKGEEGKIINIITDNSRVAGILKNLFEDILDVDHNLWQWTRQMCKYGNHFLLLDVQEHQGITGFLPIPTEEIRREEAYDGDINSVKFIWDSQNLLFDNWQIAHFRMLSNMAKFPYGTSQLESARLVWKQLQLAEDAMLIYRITRAPERRVFYIDVGNIDPADVEQYINDIKLSIKRTPMVNQGSGAMDFKYNPMAVDEDFFIPRRNDKNSEISTLPGASNLDDIGDITYIQAKLFAALKIPKAYLTFDDKINAKATLSSEDFRFARTINRIQQAVIATLTNLAIIHLYALGFREKEHLTGFKLELTNPSTQTDIEKMEIWQSKASTFAAMWNESTLSPISYVWGMKNIFDFSEDEIRAILEQQFLEGKMKLEIQKAGGSDPESMMATAQQAGGVKKGDGTDGAVGQNDLPKKIPAKKEEKPTTLNGSPDKPESEKKPKKKPFKKGTIDMDESEVSEYIDLLMESVIGKQATKPPKNTTLIKNSLSYDNTIRMLQNLDENIGKPPKKLDGKRLDD